MLKRKANRSGESSNQPKKKTQAPFVGTEPWKLVFKDAHQAFKENKFKEAIALFTRALTLKPDQITILDCRAACYEKVNEKDLGLHDASSIIKAAPQDSRGYLRAGKLLSLQKKYDKAISIYNHGLIKVDPKDTRFAMLNTMKQQAEWAARPAAKFDPAVVLPYDVFSIVFSHLSFERRIQCTAVSQRWRTFALNWSGMWRDLEFGNHKVPQKTIKKYLQYAQGRHVRSFSIHYAPKNATASILNSLINENCQYVETLDFRGCDIPITLFARMMRLVGKHVKHLQLDDSTMDPARLLDEVILDCPELTHLSIFDLMYKSDYRQPTYAPSGKLTHIRLNPYGLNFLSISHHLESIDMYSEDIEFNFVLDRVLKNHKSLETIHFTFGGGVQKTKWTPPYSSSNTSATTLDEQKGIKTLELYGDTSFTNQQATAFLNANPNIENLALVGCHRLLAPAILDHISFYGLPQLKKINLPKYASLTESHLHVLATKCPLLEEVRLPMVINVTDNILNAFATNTKNLRTLDISDCNSVTGAGLHTLVSSHQHTLEKLVINDCQRIGPDAVKWAIDQVEGRVIECKYRV